MFSLFRFLNIKLCFFFFFLTYIICKFKVLPYFKDIRNWPTYALRHVSILMRKADTMVLHSYFENPIRFEIEQNDYEVRYGANIDFKSWVQQLSFFFILFSFSVYFVNFSKIELIQFPKFSENLLMEIKEHFFKKEPVLLNLHWLYRFRWWGTRFKV